MILPLRWSLRSSGARTAIDRQARARWHAHPMPPRERAVDRGARLARRDLATIGTELRTARVSRGLTLADVAAAVRMSPSQVGRVERAIHQAATVAQLARIGAAVGLDVRVR